MRLLPAFRAAASRRLQFTQMLKFSLPNVPVKLCKTCTDARGITGLTLVDGVEIGTLVELAQWTLAAEKVDVLSDQNLASSIKNT